VNNVSVPVAEGLFDSILELAVKPVALELSEEAGQPIELKAVIVHSTISKTQCIEAERSDSGALASGEVRILLKDSGYPCSFMIEAIFDGLSPGTGFSGFSMRGKIKLDDGEPSLKLTAHTNRYNVREWSREFRDA